MSAVIVRTVVNGEPRDEPSTHDAAEAIIGRRLDRRRSYGIVRGEVCTVVRWSSACSGCSETPEGCGRDFRGVGCEECGYTGRCRASMFVPLGTPMAAP